MDQVVDEDSIAVPERNHMAGSWALEAAHIADEQRDWSLVAVLMSLNLVVTWVLAEVWIHVDAWIYCHCALAETRKAFCDGCVEDQAGHVAGAAPYARAESWIG